MKGVLCLLLTCLCVFSDARGQKKAFHPCATTIDQVPEIRGFRLGQSIENLSALVSRDRQIETKYEIGLKMVRLAPLLISEPSKLEGIRNMKLGYLDNTLVSIEIEYEKSIDWRDDMDFAGTIGTQLKLPSSSWRRTVSPSMICRGFLVMVYNSKVYPSLFIASATLSNELTKRLSEQERLKRSTFKP